MRRHPDPGVPRQEAGGPNLAPPAPLRAVALLALLIAPLQPALAAWTWSTVPSLSLDASYETNPDNLSDQSDVDKDDAYIGALGLSARVSGVSGTTRVFTAPLVRFREAWANDSNRQLDGDDIVIPASVTWSGLTSETIIAGGFSKLPSRDADYQVANPNEPLPPGGVGCNVDTSGRCRIEESQIRWYVGPTYRYRISPRTLLDLSAQYASTTYDEAEITGRFDYDYFYGVASLARIVKPRHRINFDLNASQYTSDQPGSTVENDTTNLGFTIGYEYQFSEATTINASAGSSFSDIKITGAPTTGGLPCLDPDTNEFVTCKTTTEDTNFVGELFLRQRLGDTITAQLGASREIQPNSDGAQVLVDTLNGYIEREIRRRFTAFGGATYLKQEAVGSRSEGILRQRFDREYFRVEAGMRYNFSERWSIRAQYNFYLDQQKSTLTSGAFSQELDIDNNVLSLTMRYDFMPIR